MDDAKSDFQDGNKRVASLTANKIMIENGKGIISIPVELDGTFKTMLVQYYETNQMQPLKEWVYEHCVDGVQVDARQVEEAKTCFTPQKPRYGTISAERNSDNDLSR